MRLTPLQRKTLHGLIRQILVARDGERCLRCGKTERLQMSHIYPKGTHRRIEYSPDNIKFLCVGCHMYWWHKNPVEAHIWLEGAIPKERLAKLKREASMTMKNPMDFKLHKLWLEQELARVSSHSS